mgnify:CR=1 FL=1|tara:strand:- start:337 stop:813 length:477 start_codon:yes stop_codon:yes gene_type:complete
MDSNTENIEYSKDFLCTYHLIEDLDESDLLYKIQFFQAFKIYEKFSQGKINTEEDLPIYKQIEIPNYEKEDTSVDYDKIFSYINTITEQLYEKYKNDKRIKILIDSYKSGNIEYNDEILFSQLFSFDTFFIIHKIICVENISQEEVIELIKKYKPIKI